MLIDGSIVSEIFLDKILCDYPFLAEYRRINHCFNLPLPDLNRHFEEINNSWLRKILFVGVGDRQILNEYVVKDLDGGRTVFKCTICHKSTFRKHHIVNHVESVHFPEMFRYSCIYCGKDYKTKNSLDVHVSTSHREDKNLPTF